MQSNPVCLQFCVHCLILDHLTPNHTPTTATTTITAATSIANNAPSNPPDAHDEAAIASFQHTSAQPAGTK